MNAESVTEAQRVTITTTMDQLKMKLKQIIALDNAIGEAIQDKGELKLRYVTRTPIKLAWNNNLHYLMNI